MYSPPPHSEHLAVYITVYITVRVAMCWWLYTSMCKVDSSGAAMHTIAAHTTYLSPLSHIVTAKDDPVQLTGALLHPKYCLLFRHAGHSLPFVHAGFGERLQHGCGPPGCP